MMAIDVSDSLLRQAGIDTEELQRAIEAARSASARAMRAVEERLTEELQGTRLHELADLMGARGRDAKYYGARLRGMVDSPLPLVPRDAKEGEEVLVLNQHGRLMFARRERGGFDGEGWPVWISSERPAEDHELQAEDAHRLAIALPALLRAHTSACRMRSVQFYALEELARRIEVAAK